MWQSLLSEETVQRQKLELIHPTFRREHNTTTSLSFSLRKRYSSEAKFLFFPFFFLFAFLQKLIRA